MGGEAQQRQARCDRNGGQVDLLPRGRVSTRIGAHITNESDACSLGCKHARGVCARASRRHQRYLERRGQRFTKGALDPIQCDADEVALPELVPA